MNLFLMIYLLLQKELFKLLHMIKRFDIIRQIIIKNRCRTVPEIILRPSLHKSTQMGKHGQSLPAAHLISLLKLVRIFLGASDAY